MAMQTPFRPDALEIYLPLAAAGLPSTATRILR
jgi:hypothetical protein